MSLQTVRTPFVLSDFVPLAEHERQTPESFYNGKPVLHYHTTGAKAWIAKSQQRKLPIFPVDGSSAPTAPESSTLDGQTEETVEQIVDVFVNSRNLSLFSPSAECGVSIPYQQISIHAIKTLHTTSDPSQTFPSVYLQLELSSSGGAADDDFDTVELTLIPPTPQPAPTTGEDAAPPKRPAADLFEAISDCSNLNPDPLGGEDWDASDSERGGPEIIFEGDDRHQALEGFSGVFAGARDGGLPPALPGSGGWITAENVHEFFDDEGNWIMEEGEEEEGVSGELGEGAGTVHAREEDGVEAVNGDGQGEEEGEAKRARRE